MAETNSNDQQESTPQPDTAAVDPVTGATLEKPGERRKLKSTKLDRTLVELESAFDSWNSVVPAKSAASANLSSPGRSAPLVPSPEETEFRQRTKALLSQLREQLTDLSDE